MTKERIKVSREMWTFVGLGPVDRRWPEGWVVLAFDDGERGSANVVSIGLASERMLEESPLVCAVDPRACERLFGLVPEDGSGWHVPSEPRAIALNLLNCPLPEPARPAWRVAKSIELFCGLMTRLVEGTLVPACGHADLSEGDARRIFAARRLVDERWREKLTLDAIARTCGLNRAKLTRGFRLLFDCSVADALSENRLGGARRLLSETDLPVSSIGYQCGYGNNASFTRAFSRRFGMAPTQARRVALSA